MPSAPVADEFSIDELAVRSRLPARTIREYQTAGLLPSPQRRGRVGVYGASHLARLELIRRLQARGYSLAGIRDLLHAWRDGAELGDVLGLDPDQLVHLDEPGAPVTLDQLGDLLPTVVPAHLDELIATGAVERCAPDTYCIPSPSLLQLAVDAAAAGYPPQQILELLTTIRDATSSIADTVLAMLSTTPKHADAERLGALATRGRGLLAHGTGRLTVHTIGRRLGVHHDSELGRALQDLLEKTR